MVSLMIESTSFFSLSVVIRKLISPSLPLYASSLSCVLAERSPRKKKRRKECHIIKEHISNTVLKIVVFKVRNMLLRLGSSDKGLGGVRGGSRFKTQQRSKPRRN